MPHAIAASRHSSRPTAQRVVATLLAALALAACQPKPGGGEDVVGGLLVLGKGDSPTLEVLAVRDDGAVMITVPLPKANTSWISAGSAGILAATTADGRAYASEPVDPTGPAADLAGLAWRRADSADGADPTFEGPGWFATWDPAGRSFAMLAGDLLDGGDMRLVVVDQAQTAPIEVALERPLLPAAPAWLDADRVAVVAATSDASETVIVEVATGELTDGPPDARRVATSGDGSIVATTAGLGAPVVIRSTAAWLADDGTSIGTIEVPDGFGEAIALALDASGKRLAVVWVGPEGTPRYDVHDGTKGWLRTWTAELPGAASAAVAWLR